MNNSKKLIQDVGDEFVEKSPKAFRHFASTMGYAVHKKGNRWDLVDPDTNIILVPSSTQEEIVDYLSKEFFGFEP